MRGVGGGKIFFSHYSLHEKLHFTPVSCLPPFADKMQKKKKEEKKNDNLFCRLLLFLIGFPKWKID